MDGISRPERKHVYQSRMLDSPRWDSFEPRDDDIIISTSYKGGTTWTQTIVGMLVFGKPQLPMPLRDLSPWVEFAITPPEYAPSVFGPQTHRRFLKTHLALDAVPYFDNVKYIFVARDGRDVVMSLWHHFQNYADGFLDMVNGSDWNDHGDPHPPVPAEFREFWTNWITRGWYPWESDGYPYWSHFRHARTWWDYRNLPNILLVHYNDLLADLPGEIRRIAAYLDIDLPDETMAAIAHATTFDEMKKDADRNIPSVQEVWRDYTKFFNKGTNGRWRDVLTDDDLALYEKAVERSLTPQLRAWMESGRLALGESALD